MATEIYSVDTISLIDGTVIKLTPLKIIYLREFMKLFNDVTKTSNNDEAIAILIRCATIAMRQYYPSIKTAEELEDNIDIKSLYKILDVAAGIKTKKDNSDDVKKSLDSSGTTWEEFDLAKLEAEVFLLGIWKDYEDLETSLSMPELIATLESKRELEYQEKKFLAAIQGVDLDKESGKKDAWEEMKARVFSRGKAADSNDVLALQGANAQKAGFGIGMGLSYEDLTQK